MLILVTVDFFVGFLESEGCLFISLADFEFIGIGWGLVDLVLSNDI